MSDGWALLGTAIGMRAKQRKFEGLQGQLEQSKQDIVDTQKQESDLRKGLTIANKSDDYNMTGREVFAKQLSDIQAQAQEQQNRPYDILQKMAQVNPEATQRYLKIEEYKQNQMAQAQQKQMQLQKQQIERAGQMAGTILRLPETDRKEAYQFYLNKAQQEGLDISDMPQQFNSEAEYRLMDLQDRARENENIYKGMLDERKQADVVNQQQIENKGTPWEREKFYTQQSMEQAKNISNKIFNNTSDLRKEYSGNQVIKDFVLTQNSYLNLKNIADDQRKLGNNATAASDISLIYNFMRMQDPTSTVREGEYATAENARGISDTVSNMYNKVVDGTRLTQQQRQNLVDNARTLYKGRERVKNRIDQQYKNIAKKSGLDENDILLNYQEPETSTQVKFTPEEIQAELQRRGLK